MARTSSRFVSATGALLAFAVLVTLSPALAGDELIDGPVVWHDDDQQPIPLPKTRDPALYKDYIDASTLRPLGRTLYPPRVIRNIGAIFGGDHVLPAGNVNSLGEVPNSSWFTNRIGLFPMTPEEVAKGPGPGVGPSMSGPWTIFSAKTEGVTPGFNIVDANGDRFLIKFDRKEFSGIATGAGAIGARLMYAIGYNIPDDNVVYFEAQDLRLGNDVMISDPNGRKRLMTQADLDEILATAPSGTGKYRAIASRFVDGKPVGPFNYIGRRSKKDDPNDHIDHEHRRDLRGLRIFSAWIASFDTKQHNTLDVYVGQPGQGHIRHFLIDFASSFGAGANGPTPRYNHEYTASIMGFSKKLFGLGFYEDQWRRVKRPEGLAEVSYYDAEHYHPLKYRPLMPNSAFSNLTDKDGYWAAKIISAFTDEQIRAVCEAAKYENPGATEYIARMLSARRDITARVFFDRIPPLDFFRIDGNTVRYQDLGAERGIYPGTTPRYRTRVAACSASRKARTWSEWRESGQTEAGLGSASTSSSEPFLVVECQVDRGEGWSKTIKAYVAPGSRRVVAIDR